MKSVYFALLFEASSQQHYQGGYNGGYDGGYNGGYNGGNDGGYNGGYNGGNDYYGDYDGDYYGMMYSPISMPQRPMMPAPQPMQHCFRQPAGIPCLLAAGRFPNHGHGICSGYGACIEKPQVQGPTPGVPLNQGPTSTGVRACTDDTECGYEEVCTKNVCELGPLSTERPDADTDWVYTDIFHTNPKGGDAAWLKKHDLDSLDADEDEDKAILDLIHFSGSFRAYLKDHEEIAELIEKSENIREIIEDLIDEGEDSDFANICEVGSVPRSSEDTLHRNDADIFKKAALEWFEKLDDEWDEPRKFLIDDKCPEGLNTNLYGNSNGSSCGKNSNWTGDKPDNWVSYPKKLDEYYQTIYEKALKDVEEKFKLESDELAKAMSDMLKKTWTQDPEGGTDVNTQFNGWTTDGTALTTFADTGEVPTGGDELTFVHAKDIPANTLTTLNEKLVKAYFKLRNVKIDLDTEADKFNIKQMIMDKDKDYINGSMQMIIRKKNVYGGCDDPNEPLPYLLDEWRTFECKSEKAKFLRTFEDPVVLKEIRGLVMAVLGASGNMKSEVLGEPVLDDPTGLVNFENNSMVRSINNLYLRKIYPVSKTTTSTTQPPTTGVMTQPNLLGVYGAQNPGVYGAQSQSQNQGVYGAQIGDRSFYGPNNHNLYW